MQLSRPLERLSTAARRSHGRAGYTPGPFNPDVATPRRTNWRTLPVCTATPWSAPVREGSLDFLQIPSIGQGVPPHVVKQIEARTLGLKREINELRRVLAQMQHWAREREAKQALRPAHDEEVGR